MAATDAWSANAEEEGRPPIDLAHLRRYTMGDRPLELEILGLFVDQLPLTLAALRDAPSVKEWRIAAHTLKGSSRAVGAWSLATMAEAIERLDPPPDDAERWRIIRRLEEAGSSARQFVVSLSQAA